MKLKPLNIASDKLRYNSIIGTGGIGSGKFFQLNGDHTLGREESREGHFLDIRDYCKQHIILHYCKALLGDHVGVTPIGKIGDDETGDQLWQEMQAVGLDLKYVAKEESAPTLFSFCFSYPDGSGGNMTTDNSASAKVDAAYVSSAEGVIKTAGEKGIIIAAPEVPMAARIQLLALGHQQGLLCTASFNSGEISEAIAAGILKHIDLLAINMDEAAAAGKIMLTDTNHEMVAKIAIDIFAGHNPNILVSITDGKYGSWCCDGKDLNNVAVIKTHVVSTAGAGDAFFAGLITGIATGLSFFEAQHFATLVAALSVQSPHTIHPELDRESLTAFKDSCGISFSKNIVELLKN